MCVSHVGDVTNCHMLITDTYVISLVLLISPEQAQWTRDIQFTFSM